MARTIGWILFVSGLIGLSLSLFLAALDWRSPRLAGYHLEALLAFAIIAGLTLFAGLITWRSADKPRSLGYLALLAAVVSTGALVFALAAEAKFQWMRHSVLNSDPERLATLGRHFIVGYRNVGSAQTLATRAAVGGFFITRHNVVNRDVAGIRQELDRLRALIPADASRHVWMASDQEGGNVSRLSPPLPRPDSLSVIATRHQDRGALNEAVRTYTAEKGRGLATLGIDLNLAPVLDLNHQVINPKDRYSRIYERAIAADPALVAAVGQAYCRGLAESGIRCTLKHFPGIGRVYTDTHVESATLWASPGLLSKSDWIPFRAIMAETPTPFLMLSHVRLMELDSRRPVSFSRRVVRGLLRDEWGFDGVLMTDDFSMRAVYDGEGGVGAAAVAALNAGVDLILFSYDPDLYFPAMYAVLRADAAGELDLEVLHQSRNRLGRAAPPDTPVDGAVGN